jgi:hypothetical protein
MKVVESDGIDLRQFTPRLCIGWHGYARPRLPGGSASADGGKPCTTPALAIPACVNLWSTTWSTEWPRRHDPKSAPRFRPPGE